MVIGIIFALFEQHSDVETVVIVTVIIVTVGID